MKREFEAKGRGINQKRKGTNYMKPMSSTLQFSMCYCQYDSKYKHVFSLSSIEKKSMIEN